MRLSQRLVPQHSLKRLTPRQNPKVRATIGRKQPFGKAERNKRKKESRPQSENSEKKSLQAD